VIKSLTHLYAIQNAVSVTVKDVEGPLDAEDELVEKRELPKVDGSLPGTIIPVTRVIS